MQEKYDLIGHNYNQHRQADPYILSRLQHYLQAKTEGTYLDLGCGTCNYTLPLCRGRGYFIGIDPSEKMLAVAQEKTNKIKLKVGHAEAIPLMDAYVDSIIASLTVHHWKDLKKAFEEVYRVLKPEGQIIIFTSTPQQMQGYWLNHYFPKMLAASIQQMPSLEQIEEAMNLAGMSIVTTEKYEVQNTLEDLFLYAGKHRPELYLDAAVRQGISSFSNLANREEVGLGLKQLELDIASHKMEEIINGYQNQTGDYLFVVAQKK